MSAVESCFVGCGVWYGKERGGLSVRRRRRVAVRSELGERTGKKASFGEGRRTEKVSGEEEDEREDCGWDKVEELVDVLVEKLSGKKIDVVLGITRGGMVPAVLMCEKMKLRNLMSATVMFYTDSGSRFYGLTHPSFLHFPEDQLIEGRNVLIVDDVWDTGRTARSVRERVLRAGGEPSVAVLHFKPYRNQFDDMPDFFAETTDSWIMYAWEPSPDEPSEQAP
ncbi:hypothetical protein NDN08_001267 [Rhodosorus marinus]|uniref:Phosphoribosyltransferase domain-containing protein n=1 Tax=Rhodosorus marinus TaxID=101924 RepID=A0AAV8UW39_9RHOD|nr:hypothetical protein NDN08_001267 [Rhodosorus marinus]